MRRTQIRAIAGLGLTTIVAYGAWFYAYGALIDPISSDTGWRVGFLAAVYGAAQLAGSVLAVAGGRALDRIGARPAVAGGGVLGGLGIALAASGGPVVFAAGYGIGGALVGATGFYHITLAAAARFGGERPERAVTAVTVVGAFAGPIFLPTAAILAESLGWRPAVRVLGAVAAAGLAMAAALTPRGGGAPAGDSRPGIRRVLAAALARPAARWKLVAAPVAALGYGILLVHQVPIMVAAGLSLTTAAAYTGARGLAQLGGRLLLVPAVRRAGPVRVLVGTYFLGAAGVIALTWSAVPAAAVVATVLAGLAVGAAPPIDAVYSAEVFDPAGLGTLMGVQQLLAGVVLAVGPFAVGHAFDVTGSYSIGIVASAAGFAAAALIIGRVGALAAAERSDRSRSDEVH